MSRSSALALFVPLALAGCVATAQGGAQVSVTPASPGASAAAAPSASAAVAAKPSAAPSAAGSAAPSATPSAAPTRGPRPADSAPPNGTIDKQAAFAGKPLKPRGRVAVETTQGTFVFTLFPDEAPKAVERFVSLAAKGFYDGTAWHRVIPGFVIQGGDPATLTPPSGAADALEGLPDDFKNGLKHLPGSVALARTDSPNASKNQFYVCLDRLSSLDDRYIVFGQVVGGFDVVLKIKKTGAGVTPDKMLRVVVDEAP